MADNVIELTTSRLSDPVLADMAGILGLEECCTRKAVEQSAAVIVAGMLRTSATLAGSESLLENPCSIAWGPWPVTRPGVRPRVT